MRSHQTLSGRNQNRKGGAGAFEDLNLTPFIDVFVTLIVFLLLTAVFVHLGSLRIQTPGLAKNQEQNQSDETPVEAAKQEISLFVLAEANSIAIRSYSAHEGKERVDLSSSFKGDDAQQQLSQYLKGIQEKNVFVTRVIYQVAAGVRYSTSLSILKTIETAGLTSDVILAAGLADAGKE